jgi:RNA polymerase sigma factor (sigma-70 family)
VCPSFDRSNPRNGADPDTDRGTITHWLERLKAGEKDAAQKIWEAYFRKLVPIAKKHLSGLLARDADEEDVIVSAFDSFYRGLERGRFPDLHDRDELWRLLVVITARKASDQRAHERRSKRGEGLIVRDLEDSVLELIAAEEPTPEVAAEVAESFRRLLERLEDASLRELAILRLEGFTTEEIADKLGCVPRTIERKLHLIREIWRKDAR